MGLSAGIAISPSGPISGLGAGVGAAAGCEAGFSEEFEQAVINVSNASAKVFAHFIDAFLEEKFVKTLDLVEYVKRGCDVSSGVKPRSI